MNEYIYIYLYLHNKYSNYIRSLLISFHKCFIRSLLFHKRFIVISSQYCYHYINNIKLHSIHPQVCKSWTPETPYSTTNKLLLSKLKSNVSLLGSDEIVDAKYAEGLGYVGKTQLAHTVIGYPWGNPQRLFF